MGNLMSSEATPSEVKKYGVSDATINEDKMLVDKILRKAKEMYDQNYKSFLNEDFCNNVFVAYSKKLYELPIKKNVIEGAYKQINSDSGDDFKLIIKSRSLDDEKYLISELSGRIVEHFANNKYVSSVMHEGLQLSFPDIAYIQDKALMLLEHMDKIEKQRQVGGKSRRKHPLFLDTEGGAPPFGNNNNNNEENNNANNENNENNRINNNANANANVNANANANVNANANSNANTVINNKRQNNSNNEVNNSKPIKANFSERPKQERPPEGSTKSEKKAWWSEYHRKQKKQREQNTPNIKNLILQIESIKKINSPTGPIVKNSKNNGNNRKENSEENNIFKSFNLGPVSAPVTTPAPAFPKKEPVKFSNNRIGNFGNFSKLLTTSNKPQPQQPQQPFQQQPFQPRQPFQKPPQQPFQKPPYPQHPQQPQQFLKKDSFYTGRMSNEELRRRKNIESSGDRHCTDEALECRLTKKQMCEKITYHFIVVNNLIATIVSVVPFPNESGDKYAGGFMFDRMDSLRSGKFCLPPHHSEISSISDDERLHKIFKYINILPKDNVSFEETCKRSGGFVLKLSKERMEELGRDEKFGRSYYDFFRKINLFYQEALINLYNILESLQNNTSISTRRLNELSARTKQIIDELYLKTQFNYLMAILVILDFDFAKNTKETKAKEDRMTFVKSKRII